MSGACFFQTLPHVHVVAARSKKLKILADHPSVRNGKRLVAARSKNIHNRG